MWLWTWCGVKICNIVWTIGHLLLKYTRVIIKTWIWCASEFCSVKKKTYCIKYLHSANDNNYVYWYDSTPSVNVKSYIKPLKANFVYDFFYFLSMCLLRYNLNTLPQGSSIIKLICHRTQEWLWCGGGAVRGTKNWEMGHILKSIQEAE